MTANAGDPTFTPRPQAIPITCGSELGRGHGGGGSRTLVAASSGTQHPPRALRRRPRFCPATSPSCTSSASAPTSPASPVPPGERPARFSPANRRRTGDPRSGRRGRPGRRTWPPSSSSGQRQWRRVRSASPSSAAAASDVVIAGGSLHGRDAAARGQRPALGRHRRGGRRRRILAGYRRTAESRPRSLGSTLTVGLIRDVMLTSVSKSARGATQELSARAAHDVSRNATPSPRASWVGVVG